MSSRPDVRTGVDFFRYGALPVPLVTVEEAERLAATSFGLNVRARPLGSQQDSNFGLVEADGEIAGVLKIANPAFTMAEIQAQDAAADHIAAASGLRAGTVRHGPATVVTDSGPAIARVLRYLPGGTLTGQGYLSPGSSRGSARWLGR